MALKEENKPSSPARQERWPSAAPLIARKLKKANETLARTPPRRLTPEEYFAEKERLEKEYAAANPSKGTQPQ